MTDTDPEHRARLMRARRAAQRQGLTLRKSRTRDPRALDYEKFWLDRTTTHGNRRTVTPARGLTLDEIEQRLAGQAATT
jgi:hypothetical protein